MVQTATGISIGMIVLILLHGIGCAAYIAALLLFPAGLSELTPSGGRVRVTPLMRVTAGALIVIGVGTALLPHTVTCILFFGLAVPISGLIVLPRRIRQGATAQRRVQARLLFSVLIAAAGISLVLAVLTMVLWSLGTGADLVLDDPTAHLHFEIPAGPTALLFWFSRLSSVGIATAMLVAIRRPRLWGAERIFSHGLASMIVIVLVGGGFVAVRALALALSETHPVDDTLSANVLATVFAALVFLPTYVGSETLVERLLYGRRPTPHRVLADVTALSQTTSTGGPDLARVAEAIGRDLGAHICRLNVLRPGLRDRTYTWVQFDTVPDQRSEGEDVIVLPIRAGGAQIGTIAVDRGAVAGLRNERYTLLLDVADGLGTILQATRLSIELERELRAALAHADEIAVSRRAAVAEMDHERRCLERDLHDGAQHHLVSLRLTLGLIEHELASGQPRQARDRLDQIATQIENAETVLARTATGVSSAVLTERGLAAALVDDFSGAEPPVVMDFDGVVSQRRFDPDVESAVYFCCLESVNNARKFADGAPIQVTVGLTADELQFTIRDDGPGFEPTDTEGTGRGMRNLIARVRKVGGDLTIDSAPGKGTTVRGAVPMSTPPKALDDEPPDSGDRDPQPRAGWTAKPRVSPGTSANTYPPSTATPSSPWATPWPRRSRPRTGGSTR
jgi:signal transduction histidine kinase